MINKDEIRKELEGTISTIIIRYEDELGVIPSLGSEYLKQISDLAELITEKFNQANQKVSDLYYTGGGMWCGYLKLADDLWYGGGPEGGAYYRTRQAAFDLMDGEEIAYADDQSNKLMWKLILEADTENAAYHDHIWEIVMED